MERESRVFLDMVLKAVERILFKLLVNVLGRVQTGEEIGKHEIRLYILVGIGAWSVRLMQCMYDVIRRLTIPLKSVLCCTRNNIQHCHNRIANLERTDVQGI